MVNDPDDDMPQDQLPPSSAGGRRDIVSDFTGGTINKRTAATGVKIASSFVPGGTLLDLGATAALANEESEDAREAWQGYAQKLGCSVDFLMANSQSLRCLAREETDDHLASSLSDWTGTAVGGAVGAAAGWVVPIPGASLVLGYVGSQVGSGFSTERVHSEINVRDIANEIERKQYYGEEVTADEAFLLALSPEDRKKVYSIMKAQIPEGTDPVTAKHLFKGIALDNGYLIRDKVEMLGIDMQRGEFPAEVLARAMNEPNAVNGKKLHPVLVLLDNNDNVPMMAGQGQNMADSAQGDVRQRAGAGNAGAPIMMDDAGDGEYTVPDRTPRPTAGPAGRNPRDLSRR